MGARRAELIVHILGTGLKLIKISKNKVTIYWQDPPGLYLSSRIAGSFSLGSGPVFPNTSR